MKKIPTLFVRDPNNMARVTSTVSPGCEWVLRGEGTPTVKVDGTCCMVRDGTLYARHTLKRGRMPPADFEPATEVDPNTGKQEGWIPVGDGPEHKWHHEAWGRVDSLTMTGTYELVGPKVQKNPYGLESHELVAHGSEDLGGNPRTYSGIRSFLEDCRIIEGIVWHHPDGRMAKIKRRDFGFQWPHQPKGDHAMKRSIDTAATAIIAFGALSHQFLDLFWWCR